MPTQDAVDKVGQKFFSKYFGLETLQEIETPAVLYSQSRLRENCEAVFAALHSLGVRSTFRYAVKACYLRGVLETLRDAGCPGVEIQSMLEFRIASAAGFPGETTIYNGPGKSAADLQGACSKGMFVNVDSASELSDLLQASGGRGISYGVRLDIPPDNEAAFIGAGSKFGFPPKAVARLMAERMEAVCAPHPVGVHRHCLARCNSLAAVKGSVAPILKWLSEYPGVAHRLSTVNVGGGFDSPARLAQCGVELSDLVKPLKPIVAKLARNAELVLEPGRFLVEDAAVAATRVVRKKTVGGADWLIVDIGTNLLIPLPLARFHVASVTAGRAVREYNIGDGTCSPAGVIARGVSLPELREGDRLLIAFCGAYTYSLAETFYSTIPPAYLVHTDGSVVTLLSAATASDVASRLLGLNCEKS